VRSPQDVERLGVFEPEDELSFVMEAIRYVRQSLSSEIALIGFAGAPFTLASYIIEGGYSRSFLETKKMMYGHPEAWNRFMQVLSEVTVRYLRAQVAAGAQAIQLFDSWVGALGPEDYREYVLPHSKRVFLGLQDLDVPLIHFGTGTCGFLKLMKEAGGTVQSVDWRIQLDDAWRMIGTESAIQGNLDPIAMMAPTDVLRAKVQHILDQVAGRRGHIFNLGHGFLPSTPVEHVEAVVTWVHEHRL
jgi:uroporphyrinogen decarboxylase